MSAFVTKQIVAAQALVAELRERADEGQGRVTMPSSWPSSASW